MSILLVVINIAGAIGLFIFGMKIMSASIQRFAVKTIRRTIDKMTSSVFKGILTGFVTTGLIQSSTATTVMIVSFANAGIFKLRQAISLIIGANIGTTITAWLFLVLGFSKGGIRDFLLPLLAIATPFLFARKNTLKNMGEALFGFCIMFLGLGLLKSFFEGLNLQDSPEFISFINSFGSMGFASVLLFLVIGTLLTVIVQSSTVAMGFTLAFCTSGLPLELGAALVLGENLGTTATANIAALVANVHGKRAARAHTFLNLIEITWFLIFFNPIISMVDKIVSMTDLGSPLEEDNIEAVAAALAFIHTFVNLTNAFLCGGFVKNIEKIIVRLTPSASQNDEEYALAYMQRGLTSTSDLYLLEAKKQLTHFGLLIKRMSDSVNKLLFEPDPEDTQVLMEKINQYENITDKVEQQVSDYLTKISQQDVAEIFQLKSMLDIVTELEEAGHTFYQTAKAIEQKNKEKIWLTTTQRQNLKEIFGLLDNAIECMYQNLKKEFEEVDLSEARQIEEQINNLQAQLRQNYILQTESKEFSIKSGLVYHDLFSQCERIGNNIYKVSELMKGK